MNGTSNCTSRSVKRETCPECGGRKAGRGYRHSDDCANGSTKQSKLTVTTGEAKVLDSAQLSQPCAGTSVIPIIDVDLIKVPEKGQSPVHYQEFLRDMSRYADIFDERLGRIRWLQGRVLNFVRPQIKGTKEWNAYLQSVRMKPTTAKYCRKVAQEIPEQVSHDRKYTEMLAVCYPSYHKRLEEQITQEIEQEDEQDFGSKKELKIHSSQDCDEHRYGLSILQKLLHRTKGAIQDWRDNEIARDIGFDIVENTARDVLTQIDVIRADLSRIRAQIETFVSPRKTG
jgi:hypothetical protein